VAAAALATSTAIAAAEPKLGTGVTLTDAMPIAVLTERPGTSLARPCESRTA
jgi:hypothetical protein